MEPIRIGGNGDKDTVKNMLNKHFFNSKVEIQEQDYDKRFDFMFYLAKNKSFDEIAFYDSLANLIQDIVINIYVKQIIKDRVGKICTQYTLDEKNEIIKYTHNILKNKNNYPKERQGINRDIVDYLIENKSISIDGYMRFRLKEYLYIVDISIEDAIFDLESEREYEEFLSMLQYFVDIQEPKLELVNVIIQDQDYFLIDLDNEILETGILDEINKDLYGEEVSKADLLVSSLIVLSPEKLVIHIEEGKEKELMDVISEIFRDRVTICNGCEKCKINVKLKRGK